MKQKTKNRKQKTGSNRRAHLYKILFVICCLLFALVARAQTSYTLPTLGTLQANSPDTLVKLIFEYSLIIAALAGFGAFLYGGIMYLTAAGNPARAEEAKDRLIHAVLGFLIVAFSGITLRLINPDLFAFNKVSLPSVAPGIVQPLIQLPNNGYLSCQPQAGGVNACTPVTDGTTCGDDEQCAPCISLSQGQACTPVRPTGQGRLTYTSCVPNNPCLSAAQGGSCPPNYPCSEITGGRTSNWQVAPDSVCQNPQEYVECTDGEVFQSAAYICCTSN